jgi:hypothetical protein
MKMCFVCFHVVGYATSWVVHRVVTDSFGDRIVQDVKGPEFFICEDCFNNGLIKANQTQTQIAKDKTNDAN